MLRSAFIRKFGSAIRARPQLKRALVSAEKASQLLQHTAAHYLPAVIQPSPIDLSIAITANCNYRCLGCRYGRDFMTGQRLSLSEVAGVLDDAYAAGINSVRFYGGEPLLHNDLPKMVEYAIAKGMTPVVNTNGFLLDRKFKGLHQAGLRILSIGYYGSPAQYERYTGVKNGRESVEAGLRSIRENFGDQVRIRLNFVLNRQTCSIEELRQAWDLACRYNLFVQVDLVHYSFPYFTSGPEGELAFRDEDEAGLKKFLDMLFELRRKDPGKMYESDTSLRSIPDWALKKAEMRVPCDAYKMLWVGADGSVQMCYVAFPLGNIHQTPLRDMLFGDAHSKAARDGFQLNCPNCQCGRDSRINTHLPSLLKYRAHPSPEKIAQPVLIAR